jgi:hypothetical protein
MKEEVEEKVEVEVEVCVCVCVCVCECVSWPPVTRGVTVTRAMSIASNPPR